MSSSYQVGPETFVTLRFTVFDAEGESASDVEIMAAVFGMGQLLPAVERAIDGKSEGDTLKISLSEKEAYGARDPKGLIEVDRADFPEDVAPGDRFEVENAEGGVLVLHVLDVHEEVVVVDTNHPLAGQDVTIDVEILEVRPARAEEIEDALFCLEEGQSETEADHPHERSGAQAASLELDAGTPLIRPADLLRGGR